MKQLIELIKSKPYSFIMILIGMTLVFFGV